MLIYQSLTLVAGCGLGNFIKVMADTKQCLSSLETGGRKGKYMRAHRFAHEQWIGRIPAGLEVDHICRQPLCVNPLHLEAVTPLVNRQLAVAARGIHV